MRVSDESRGGKCKTGRAAPAEVISSVAEGRPQQPRGGRPTDNSPKGRGQRPLWGVGRRSRLAITTGCRAGEKNHVVELDEGKSQSRGGSRNRVRTPPGNVALGARAAGRRAHPRHPHLHSVTAHRRRSAWLRARPSHHRRQVAGIRGTSWTRLPNGADLDRDDVDGHTWDAPEESGLVRVMERMGREDDGDGGDQQVERTRLLGSRRCADLARIRGNIDTVRARGQGNWVECRQNPPVVALLARRVDKRISGV